MTETEKERLIKDIQEAIVEIPFTGSAKEIQTYINAYMDAQERILELIGRVNTIPEPEPVRSEPNPKPSNPKPRTSKIDKGKVIALYKATWNASKISGEVGCSEASVYAIVKDARECGEIE